MSWGIADTATQKEKLKSEFSDYINGLNSTGCIEYSTYSDLFDFTMDILDKIYQQGFEDAKNQNHIAQMGGMVKN